MSVLELVRSNIQKAQHEDAQNIFLIDQLCEVWKRFVGKPITKLMEIVAKEKMPDYQFYMDLGRHQLVTIEVWGKGIPHEARKCFVVAYGYQAKRKFDLQHFKDQNENLYKKAYERNALRQKALEDPRLTEICELLDYANSKEDLLDQFYTDYYRIRKTFGICLRIIVE